MHKRFSEESSSLFNKKIDREPFFIARHPFEISEHKLCLFPYFNMKISMKPVLTIYLQVKWYDVLLLSAGNCENFSIKLSFLMLKWSGGGESLKENEEHMRKKCSTLPQNIFPTSLWRGNISKGWEMVENIGSGNVYIEKNTENDSDAMSVEEFLYCRSLQHKKSIKFWAREM